MGGLMGVKSEVLESETACPGLRVFDEAMADPTPSPCRAGSTATLSRSKPSSVHQHGHADDFGTVPD